MTFKEYLQFLDDYWTLYSMPDIREDYVTYTDVRL
jgi:hypothetical protein